MPRRRDATEGEFLRLWVVQVLGDLFDPFFSRASHLAPTVANWCLCFDVCGARFAEDDRAGRSGGRVELGIVGPPLPYMLRRTDHRIDHIGGGCVDVQLSWPTSFLGTVRLTVFPG